MSELKFEELVELEIIEFPTGEKKTTTKRKRTGTLLIGGRSIKAKLVISMIKKGLLRLVKQLLPFYIFIHSAVSSTGISMPVNIQDNAIGPKTTVEENLVQISYTIAVDPKE